MRSTITNVCARFSILVTAKTRYTGYTYEERTDVLDDNGDYIDSQLVDNGKFDHFDRSLDGNIRTFIPDLDVNNRAAVIRALGAKFDAILARVKPKIIKTDDIWKLPALLKDAGIIADNQFHSTRDDFNWFITDPVIQPAEFSGIFAYKPDVGWVSLDFNPDLYRVV